MWFLSGIVCSLAFACYVGYRRLVLPRSWNVLHADGASYQFRINRSKRGIRSVHVVIACPDHFDFTLRRENAVDRFFVHVGLSVEQQVGEMLLDGSVYILPDKYRIGGLLRGDPSLSDALSSFLYNGGTMFTKVQRVRCVGGRLCVELKPTDPVKRFYREELTRALLPALRNLVSRLSQSASQRVNGRRDCWIFKSVVLLAIASGLAANGAISLSRIFRNPFPAVVDHADLVVAAAGLGCIVFLVLFGVCIYWFRGTSRAHVVALELLLMGTFGGVSTGYVELLKWNAEYDSAQARSIPATITAVRRISNWWDETRRYEITFAPREELAPFKLKVRYPDFRRFEQGGEAVLQVQPGALRYRWIGAIETVR